MTGTEPDEAWSGTGDLADRSRRGPEAVHATVDVPPNILQMLKLAGRAVEPSPVAAIEAALQGTGAPCLILWGDPTLRLSEALRHGADTGHAILAWCKDAADLLGLTRRHRSRVTLVAVQALTSNSDEAQRRALCARLGCPTLSLPLDPAADCADPLAYVLAAALVPQIIETRDIQTDLEAKSLLSPPPGPAIPSLADTARIYTEARGRIADEVDLLKTQISLQQQEVRHVQARAAADLRAEVKSRETVEGQRDALQRRVAELTSQLDKLCNTSFWRGLNPKRRMKAVTRLKAELEIAQRRGAELDGALTRERAVSEKHARTLKDRDVALKAAEARTRELDKVLRELEAQVKAAEARTRELDETLQEKTAQLEAAESRARELNGASSEAGSTAEQEDRAIAILQARIAELTDALHRGQFDQRRLSEDLRLALRTQDCLDTDLRELRERYAQVLVVKGQQEELLRLLTPRLRQAAEHLQSLSVDGQAAVRLQQTPPAASLPPQEAGVQTSVSEPTTGRTG